MNLIHSHYVTDHYDWNGRIWSKNYVSFFKLAAQKYSTFLYFCRCLFAGHAELLYSSNEIRKAQNEHLIIMAKFDRSAVMNLRSISFFLFLCFYGLVFDLETIGVR